MPNLAAANGDSITAVYAGDTVINDSGVKPLLESWGACIRLDREDQFAGFTALSACGVGYIARVVATIEEEAIQQGFGQQRARNIANGTLRSVASLLSEDMSAAELASRVASRGGATEAGFKVMEREGVWRGMVLGIRAAADKTRALGRLASGAKSSKRFGLRLWRNR